VESTCLALVQSSAAAHTSPSQKKDGDCASWALFPAATRGQMLPTHMALGRCRSPAVMDLGADPGKQGIPLLIVGDPCSSVSPFLGVPRWE
jgi:hypothetical protein